MSDINKSLGEIEGLLKGMESGGMDTGTLLAMMNNGGGLGGNNNMLLILLFLFLFRKDGFGGAGEAVAVEGQIEAAINKAAANQASFDAVKDAVLGNGADIRQLAQTLNCDINALNGAISDLKYAISSVSAEVQCGNDKVIGAIAANGERIINSIIQGNCDIKSAISNCCCDVLRSIDRNFADLALRDQANSSAIQLAISQLSSTVKEEGAATRQVVIDTARDQDVARLTRELESARRGEQTAEIIKALS